MKTIGHLHKAYQALTLWYNTINDKNHLPKLEDVKEKFDLVVGSFCKENGLENIAYTIVNKYTNSVELIQGDSVKNIGLPFIKYPEENLIDIFFGYKRTVDSISSTEFFSHLYGQSTDAPYLYVCNIEILAYVYLWHEYAILRKTGGYDTNSIEYSFSNLVKKLEKDNEYSQEIATLKNNEYLFLKKILDMYENTESIRIETNKILEKAKYGGIDTNDNNRVLEFLHKTSRVPIIPYYVQFLQNIRKSNVFNVGQLVIPISTSSRYLYEIKNSRQLGANTFLVATINSQKDTIEEDFIHDVQLFFSIIATPVIDIYFYGNVLLYEYVRSALAQVMARNLSHNLGSHVIVNAVNIINNKFFVGKEHTPQYSLKDNYTRKQTKLATDIDELLKKMKQKNDAACKDHCKTLDETIKEVLEKDDKYISYTITLLNYIKTRMDFIADITTSTPAMENTKSLMEIINGFTENRLMVDTISGIDNFKYHIDCLNFESTSLSVPNDILGCHAFYTILENLIRNLAKHGKVQSGSDVKIKIEIKDITEISGQNTFLDDCNKMSAVSIIIENDVTGKTKIRKKNAEEIKKSENNDVWKEVKEEDGIEIDTIDWHIYNQNNQINKSIIDKKNNKLRLGGWGFLEMEASAAYLRKLPIEDIEKDEYEVSVLNLTVDKNSCFELAEDSMYTKDGKNLHIFKAYRVKDNENNKNYLAYRFFMYKPREVLIIGDKTKIFENPDAFLKQEKEWLKAGIEIISKIDDIIYPHKLVVDFTSENQLMNNPCFSSHILKQDSTKIKNIEEEDKKDVIIKTKNELWEKYRNDIEKKVSNFLTKDMLVCSNHGDDFEKMKKSSNYVEIRTSDNGLWTDMKKVNKWDLSELHKWVINCNAKIKVIDERIQSFAIGSYYFAKGGTAINYNDIYETTCILVPNRNIDLIDLNEQSFDKSYSDIIQYIKKDKDIDFLVIHLGIIEKLISSYNEVNENPYDKENPENVSKFIKNELCSFPNSENCSPIIEYDKVVVISGRGKPHNLPHDIRYLNYSIVAQYLIDHRCKYAFAEAIYSARRFIQ